MKKYLILIILFNCLYSCREHKSNRINKGYDSISIDDTKNEATKELQLNSNKTGLNLKEMVFLDSLQKKYDFSNISTEEAKEIGCSEWKIEQKQIIESIRDMELVGSIGEWYSLCSIYPCYYQSRVIISNKEFQMFISAAGYIRFKSADEDYIFITRKPNNVFLSICNPELTG